MVLRLPANSDQYTATGPLILVLRLRISAYTAAFSGAVCSRQVRSELKKSLEEPEAEDEDDTKRRAKERRRKEAEEKAMNIRTSVAKSVYQWLVKPPRNQKLNEMFLPGRTSFMFDLVRKRRGVVDLLRVLDLFGEPEFCFGKLVIVVRSLVVGGQGRVAERCTGVLLGSGDIRKR